MSDSPVTPFMDSDKVALESVPILKMDSYDATARITGRYSSTATEMRLAPSGGEAVGCHDRQWQVGVSVPKQFRFSQTNFKG